jgi:hypothetical protein
LRERERERERSSKPSSTELKKLKKHNNHVPKNTTNPFIERQETKEKKKRETQIPVLCKKDQKKSSNNKQHLLPHTFYCYSSRSSSENAIRTWGLELSNSFKNFFIFFVLCYIFSL